MEELAGDIGPVVDHLRDAGAIVWVPSIAGWMVVGRAAALSIMRDPDRFTVDDPRFSTARVVGPSMLSLDGIEHARHRAPFARSFRRSAVEGELVQAVESDLDRLLGRIDRSASVELRDALARPLAVASMQRVLGLEAVLDADLLAWYDAIVQAVTEATPDEPVAIAGTQAFDRLSQAIRASLDADRGSLLHATIRGADLTRSEIVSNAAVMLFGGIETTEAMIANAFWYGLSEDGCIEHLRREPRLLARLVEESLRLEPAASVVDRYATVDVGIDGAVIRAGDLVRVSLTGANRDPETFDDPHRFRLERPNAHHHVAFAQGPHVCPGMHLARLETRVALERTLDAFPALALDREASTAPAGLIFRKASRVVVRSEPRRPD